jgi:23S rRNA (uracil1939-C5)-methyltransferase
VEIHGIAAGGAGVGHLADGRAVFVHRTAPGDRARVSVTAGKARWARGVLRGLDEASPARRPPPCPHYDRCGGCTLQHLQPQAQREARGALVREALVRIGKLDDVPEVGVHAPGPEFGYRNRASFTLRRLGVRRGSPARRAPPPVVAGFHALERPGHVVDVGTAVGGPCLLLEPALQRLWDGVRGAWGPDARNLPAGAVLRLTLRALDDGSGILLVEGGAGDGQPHRLLAGVEGLRAVWARAASDAGAPRLLAGSEDPVEHWFGEALPIRPGAFLQVNREAAAFLHRAALEALDPQPGDRVLDGYAGFGAWGRAAARLGAEAVGIEADPGAVAMGRAHPVPGFELLEGTVEALIETLLPADRVVLNPPRTGLHEAVPAALAAHPPRRLVYVSCDPATLARDLERLGPGFRVRGVQAVDLFPQTAHVEIIVTLDGAV